MALLLKNAHVIDPQVGLTRRARCWCATGASWKWGTA